MQLVRQQVANLFKGDSMIFDLPMFTLIHVVISVLGIIAGLVAVGGLMAGARLDGWTALFLVTTILTSVTGFGFPFTKVTPPHVVGALSLVMLAVYLAARYWKQLERQLADDLCDHRRCGALSQRVRAGRAALRQDAPARAVGAHAAGGPFVGTQALVFALFVGLGWAALRAFRTGKASG